MAKGPKKPKVDEAAQPALVPMSEQELQDAGRTLATKVKELEDLKEAHGEEKTAMRAAEKKLAGEIAAVASTIRTQGR